MPAPPSIRIFPMSEKQPGFVGRSIDDVQRRLFARDLIKGNGRWRYNKTGLNAPPRTLVLFQFKARIIASAIFLRDEKLERPRRGCSGVLHFDPGSIATFAPIDLATMSTIWPSFRSFGHVKQHLNPAMYAKLKRRTKTNAEARKTQRSNEKTSA
jgi:hypothetical protein